MADIEIIMMPDSRVPIVVPETLAQTTDLPITWQVTSHRDDVTDITIEFKNPNRKYFKPEPNKSSCNGKPVEQPDFEPANNFTKSLVPAPVPKGSTLPKHVAFFRIQVDGPIGEGDVRTDEYLVKATFEDGSFEVLDPKIKSTDP